MTTWFTRATASAFALAVLSLASCKKDETQVVLKTVAAPTLMASTTTPDLVLTTTNSNTTGDVFTYTAADFGYQSVTSYTIQIDKKGGNFSSPQTFSAGSAPGTLTLTKAQFANAFFALGYAYGVTAQVDVRIVASVADGAPTQASPVVTITATPTPVCIANTVGSWGLVGPAGDGWPGNTVATATDRALTYDCYTQTFSLTTALTAGAFKFRANKDWGTNLGGMSNNFTAGVPLTLGGGDLSVAKAGTYKVTLTVTTDTNGNVNGGTVTLK